MIRFLANARYRPVLKGRTGGFLVLADGKEGEAEEFYDDEEVGK